MKHGGNQGGRPKGSKGKTTLDKEAARSIVRERVFAEIHPLLDAQLANCKGIKYLVAREKKTGKFKKLTEAEAILKLGQESESEIIEIWEERPNVQAFTDLMNRAIDKPKEQAIEVDLSITQLDQLIRAARERVGS